MVSIVPSHKSTEPNCQKVNSLGPQEGFSQAELSMPEDPKKAQVISFMEKMTDIFMKAKSSFMNKRDLDSMRVCGNLYMEYKKEYMVIMNSI